MGRFSFLSYPETTIIWNVKDLTRPNGRWGPTTSSIDWCELNYAITPWIAEFVNTITNAGFVALALHTIACSLDQRLPTRIIVSSLAVVFVGVGSALFHGTLLFEFQLLDELPMIYATSIVTWIVYDLTPVTRNSKMLYPFLILSYNIAFTVAYLTFPNPIFHQVCYGTMTGLMIFRIAVLLLEKVQGTAANLESRRMMIHAVLYGAVAFLIWNLDNFFCARLSEFKATLPLAFSFLFEGHGWWHVLMGFSIYNLNLAVAYLTLAIRDSPEHYRLRRSYGGLIKVLERTEKGWRALDRKTEGKKRT